MGGIKPDRNNERFHGMPEQLQELLYDWGFIMAEEAPEHVHTLFRRNYDEGQCLLCTKQLGESTVMVVDGEGVQAIFCSFACWQDMNIMHWLQEQYDDLTSSARARRAGGEHEEAEREGSEEGEEAQEEIGEAPEPSGDPRDPRDDEQE